MTTKKDDIKKIRDLIFDSIHWSETPQGGEYWATVYENLEKLEKIPAKQEKLGQEEIDGIKEACDLIQESFIWRNTPQGHDYWSDVWDNLDKIVKDQEKNNKKKDHCDCGFCEDS
jgi:hypothetical protein